jgi:hypothetical protein
MGFTTASASDDPTSIKTTTGSNTFSPEMKTAVNSAMTRGKNAFSAPWTQLNASNYVAPANAAQQQYWTDAKNLQGPAEFDQSGNLYTGVGNSTFNQAQAQQYMSPYLSNVAQTTMADLQRQHDRELAQLNLKNTLGAGLGSSGFALSQALSNQDYGNLAASTYAKLQQAAYENAQKQYNDEQNRRIQAAQGLGSLGTSISNADIERLKQQGLAGADQYSIAQKLKDLQLEEARTAREAPMKQATNEANFLNTLPKEAFSTDVQNIYGTDPSILNSIIGTGGSLLDIINKGGDINAGIKGLKEGWDTIKGWFSP